jgi:hypothetical protein
MDSKTVTATAPANSLEAFWFLLFSRVRESPPLTVHYSLRLRKGQHKCRVEKKIWNGIQTVSIKFFFLKTTPIKPQSRNRVLADSFCCVFNLSQMKGSGDSKLQGPTKCLDLKLLCIHGRSKNDSQEIVYFIWNRIRQVWESLEQGCQIFLGPNIPNREKYTKWPPTIPNGHELYQMGVNYSKWS